MNSLAAWSQAKAETRLDSRQWRISRPPAVCVSSGRAGPVGVSGPDLTSVARWAQPEETRRGLPGDPEDPD